MSRRGKRRGTRRDMSLRKLFVMASLVAIATAAAPAKASADWLFTPFIGATFGGSADVGGGGESFSSDFERKVNYGAALEWMGGGVFGFGVDFGYSPNFFGASTEDSTFDLVGDGNVTTLMANVIVGAPLGGVRPYDSGGVGLLKQKVDSVGLFFDSIDNTDFGFNAGAGLIGFFTENIGIRGDIRYFRSMRNTDPDGVDLELGQFKFWRGTVVVTFKF
ncbi:MAG: outer membrane beta-barrel protein [Actinobacteria bacterium]|nr:outer membrane beta-barrel protein [Actinomycetota bacterium]